MRTLTILFLFSLFLGHLSAQSGKTEYVFLITFDGLRWEEVFGGADDSLTFLGRKIDLSPGREILDSVLTGRYWVALQY